MFTVALTYTKFMFLDFLEIIFLDYTKEEEEVFTLNIL